MDDDVVFFFSSVLSYEKKQLPRFGYAQIQHLVVYDTYGCWNVAVKFCASNFFL